METITNAASSVATTVSKTIWGEQNPQNPTPGNETAGQEPISGVKGKGTATEPFDQGNAETTASGTTSGTTSKLTSDTPASSSNLTSSTPATNEAPLTERTGAMDSISPNTNNASNAGATDPLLTTDKTGASGALSNPTKGSDVVPTESQHPGVAPTSGGVTHQKEQGADRPIDVPGTEEKSAISSKTNEAEAALQKRDPNDHSGEPMKMHTSDSTSANPTEWDERRESKTGNLGGKEHGKEHGTGEEWVKTSGLAADGGDFDATKPGAGKEATRLFEEKGLTKSAPGEEPKSTGKGSFDSPRQASGASGEKEKIPLKEKVKQKLHIGSHKKDKE